MAHLLSRRHVCVLAGGVLATSLAAPSAKALTIAATFDSSITTNANSASIISTINSAISDYQTKFTDPITVNITFQGMTSGLGASSTSIVTIPYQTYLSGLTADAKTSNDTTALAHLPIQTTNPANGSNYITLSYANYKALGLGNLGGSDGTVSLNFNLTNPPQTDTSLTYSLKSVVQHEIDEVLGFFSTVGSGFDPAPQDLYRYTAAGARTYTTVGDDAYFSIDGTTDLARFNQDGQGDYGDFHDGGTPQVQDAYGTQGSAPQLGVELIGLDAIGYDLAAVPEPATISILAVAAGGLLLRRRK